ncbi:MAG: TadE/TadG family type IV pilus assembly protein [Microthrixaceae bacterium]
MRPSDRGQSTVELALIIPVVVLLILLCVQAALVLRDRLFVVHAARTAARAVIVEPNQNAAESALRSQGPPISLATVTVSGGSRGGSLATVVVRLPATQVPIVGRVVASTVLEQRLVVMVEGAN